jgi:hypothetical protein
VSLARKQERSKGPWRVDERASDHADHGVIVDADGMIVATVHQDDGMYGDGPDARLIAAAPEMYALLERLDDPDADREDLIATWKRLKARIDGTNEQKEAG